MFLLGETWRARAGQESAEAIVVWIPGENRVERRAEESREDHSLDRMWKARSSLTRSRRCNSGSYRGGGPSSSGWIPAKGEARGGQVFRVPRTDAQRGPMGVHLGGRLRAKPARLNRRMRKTACPVVWEGWRAQSRQPDPIRAGGGSRMGAGLSRCFRTRASASGGRGSCGRPGAPRRRGPCSGRCDRVRSG